MPFLKSTALTGTGGTGTCPTTNAGHGYQGNWQIASVGSTSITITSPINLGSASPTGATVEKPNACLVIDNVGFSVGDYHWNNIIFEGIDQAGSAGDPGTASVLLDGSYQNTGGTGTYNFIGSVRFTGDTFDVGQTGLMVQGIPFAIGGANNFSVSNVEVNGGTVRFAKNAMYVQSAAGIKFAPHSMDFNGFPFPTSGWYGPPYKYLAADFLTSAAVWINNDQNLGTSQGIWIQGFPTRGPEWFTGTNLTSNLPNYGLRLTINPNTAFTPDLTLESLDVYGLVAPVLLEYGPTGYYTYTGLYSSSTTYSQNQMVSYSPTSGAPPVSYLYINGTPSSGNLPTNGTYWAGILFPGGAASPRIMTTGCQFAFGTSGESSSTRIPTLASAGVLTLPFGDIFIISGSTSIGYLLGGWIGRVVTLIAQIGFATVGGGNMAAAVTLTAGQAIDMIFDGTYWYPKV